MKSTDKYLHILLKTVAKLLIHYVTIYYDKC